MKFGGCRVFKVDYFILPLFLVPKLSSVAQNEWKKHPYIFLVKIKLLNGFFFNFFRSNSFIFEPKVEKLYMGVFFIHFVPLNSILAPKIMKE